jgi:hypothetical protein
MIDGSDRVEFANVEVINQRGFVLTCRVGDHVVGVPELRMLLGTKIHRTGDRGRLVLRRDAAVNLGLLDRSRCESVRSNGEPCQADRRADSGFCWSHDPALAGARAAAQARAVTGAREGMMRRQELGKRSGH